MNRIRSSYYKVALNATRSDTFVRSASTGKERDEETGYNYHGARYYDASILTGWLSVDPVADNYPSLSPYNYCALNPVKLVDPDGKEFGDYYSFSGKYLGTDGIDDGLIHIVKDPKAIVACRNHTIYTTESNIAFTANYQTFKEIENVYIRTNTNTQGRQEECTAMIGRASIRGETGWRDKNGAHCNYPLKFGWHIDKATGCMEENIANQLISLGHISIHSHLFNHPDDDRWCSNMPSDDDRKNIIPWASLNVIIGYSKEPTNPYPKSLIGIEAAFYDDNVNELGTMSITAIKSIVKDQEARYEY